MPIPKVLPIGILPPFLKSPIGTSPAAERTGVSPYLATALELVERYATSVHRVRVLEGLLAYRAELRRIGLSGGFQWIDGSFVETLNREPNDVDVVTVASLPASCDPADEKLFDAREARKRFLCDAYFVDLAGAPLRTVAESVYWYGLFSHQRQTLRWKGIVQIDLAPHDGDEPARTRLEGLKSGAV